MDVIENIVKNLIKNGSDELISALIGKKVEGVSFEDNKKTKVDIAFKGEVDDHIEIVHICIAKENIKDIEIHMIEYFLDLYKRFPEYPIKQFLVYIGSSECKMKDGIKKDGLEYSYKLVDISQRDDIGDLKEKIELLFEIL